MIFRSQFFCFMLLQIEIPENIKMAIILILEVSWQTIKIQFVFMNDYKTYDNMYSN